MGAQQDKGAESGGKGKRVEKISFLSRKNIETLFGVIGSRILVVLHSVDYFDLHMS